MIINTYSFTDMICPTCRTPLTLTFPLTLSSSRTRDRYEILLPDISGDLVLGTFMTAKQFPEFVDIMVAGDNGAALRRSKTVHAYTESIVQQQMMDLATFRHEIGTYQRSYADYDRYSEIWGWIGDLLLAPSADVTTVFHQGSQNPMAALLDKVAGSIVERHVGRLELPIRDASAVGAWYFAQLEELLRDVFRVYYAVPRVARAMASGSHVGLHHSDYALPMPEGQEITSDEVEKALAVVRKVFEIYVETYLTQLQGVEGEAGHRGTTWASGSLRVVSLDVVSDRRKLKGVKKSKSDTPVPDSDDDGDGDGGQPTEADRAYALEQAAKAEAAKKEAEAQRRRELELPPKGTFSLGFLDKTQWKFLKSILADVNATHMVVNLEHPFIPLTGVPKKGTAPTVLAKGSTLDWAPIEQDLETFFELVFKWMAPRKGEAPRRHLVVLSTAPVPYATTVVETRTGSKVMQLCVGPLGVPGESAKVPVGFVGGSRIGTAFRYTHRLHGLEDILVDSSRGVQLGEDHGDGGQVDINAQYACTGIGQLRVWFDSWRATGTFNFAHMAPGLKLSDGLAILLVGPVLGAPRVVRKQLTDYGTGGEGDGDVEDRIEVPLMLECDRAATVTVQVINAFTKEEELFHFDCPQCIPFVGILGPFPKESRFVCAIVNGVQHCPFMHFTVSTHFHPEETNVAILNCAPYDKAEQVCSHFVADLGARCALPFSGIAVVVHLDCTINLDSVIDGWLATEAFVDEANRCYRKREFSQSLRSYISKIEDSMRTKFRNFFSRPSYRELLRTANNILSPKVLYQSDERLAEELSVEFAIDDDIDDEAEGGRGGDDDEDATPRSVGGQEEARVVEGADVGDGGLEQESLISHMTLHDQGKEHVRALLYLVAARLVQEYMCCLRAPESDNLVAYSTRALSSHLADLALDDDSNGEGMDIFMPQVTGDGKFVYSIIKELPLAEAVFHQWRSHLLPAVTSFVTWVSPNGKLSIEQLLDVNQERHRVAEELLRRSPIEDGTRVIMLCSNDRYDQDPAKAFFQGGYQTDTPEPEEGEAAPEPLAESESTLGYALRGTLMEWTHETVEVPAYAGNKDTRAYDAYMMERKRLDRDYQFVSPSDMFGTRARPLGQDDAGGWVSVTMLDSLYRNNVFEFGAELAAAETAAKKEAKGKKRAGALSKKVINTQHRPSLPPSLSWNTVPYTHTRTHTLA